MDKTCKEGEESLTEYYNANGEKYYETIVLNPDYELSETLKTVL